MKRSSLALLLMILVALAATLAGCGTTNDYGQDTPTPITGSGTGSTPATGGGNTGSNTGGGGTTATQAPPAGAQVGTPVKVNDYTISVDSAKIDNDSVVVTFTVDNTSGSAQVNLPVTAFDATAPDSTQSMDQDILCSDLAVNVPQGKKVTGNICWKANGATATKGVTVHYDAGSAGKLNWVLP